MSAYFQANIEIQKYVYRAFSLKWLPTLIVVGAQKLREQKSKF